MTDDYKKNLIKLRFYFNDHTRYEVSKNLYNVDFARSPLKYLLTKTN